MEKRVFRRPAGWLAGFQFDSFSPSRALPDARARRRSVSRRARPSVHGFLRNAASFLSRAFRILPVANVSPGRVCRVAPRVFSSLETQHSFEPCTSREGGFFRSAPRSEGGDKARRRVFRTRSVDARPGKVNRCSLASTVRVPPYCRAGRAPNGKKEPRMHDINLGAAIARERRAAQVTQGELAAHLGVTKAAVSKWELEQSMPDAGPACRASPPTSTSRWTSCSTIGRSWWATICKRLPEAARAVRRRSRSRFSRTPRTSSRFALLPAGPRAAADGACSTCSAQTPRPPDPRPKLWPHAPQSCFERVERHATMWSLCAPRG